MSNQSGNQPQAAPSATRLQAQEKAKAAVDKYENSLDDRDAVHAATAIQQAHEGDGSDDLKDALRGYDPLTSPAEPRTLKARYIVQVFAAERADEYPRINEHFAKK